MERKECVGNMDVLHYVEREQALKGRVCLSVCEICVRNMCTKYVYVYVSMQLTHLRDAEPMFFLCSHDGSGFLCSKVYTVESRVR